MAAKENLKKQGGIKKKFQNWKWQYVVAVVLLLIVGTAGGLALGLVYGQRKTNTAVANAVRSIVPVRENDSDYQYIKPLLSYDFSDVKNFDEDDALHTQLNSYVQSQISVGNAKNISVYVRDLANGSWASVNENQLYHPASMLKVVIMIAYYKQSEQDSSLLQKQYVYTAAINNQQATDIDFDQPTNMTVGNSYTVEQLIENMIINSDNGAETLLYDNINQTSLNDVYTDLSLPSPLHSNDYTISAKQYAVLLRVLYNADYLSQDDSEKALEIMSKATYKNGIVAGLPNGIAAAQKFGEHVDGTTNNIQDVELHDCGVVYGKDAYTICVMTEGKSIPTLQGIIKDISQTVYESISATDNDYK